MAQGLLGLGIGVLLATLAGFVGDYGAYVRAAGVAETRADREAVRLAHCPPGEDCVSRWDDDGRVKVCKADAAGWVAQVRVSVSAPSKLLIGIEEVTAIRGVVLQPGVAQAGPFHAAPDC